MYVAPDKLSNTGKSAVEALFNFAETQLRSIENVTRINLGSAREGFEYGADHVKAIIACLFRRPEPSLPCRRVPSTGSSPAPGTPGCPDIFHPGTGNTRRPRRPS